MPSNISSKSTSCGIVDALAAFVIWGLLPLYWSFLSHVDTTEILLHRILWSACALVGYFSIRGRLWHTLKSLCFNGRKFRFMIIGSLLISANWLIYIWAIKHQYVLESSLGYFINPILNVVIGAVVLKERLSLLQWTAVALVFVAISFSVIEAHYFPWVALSLAFSFAAYGLVKKLSGVGALDSLLVETLLAAAPAAGYMALLLGSGSNLAFLGSDIGTRLLLMGGGVVTALPLIFFGRAAQRLRLATLGFMQFIAPTLQFALGVWYFAEPLNSTKLNIFVLVWFSVALYLVGSRKAKVV